jgi:hypothetical protein
MSVDVVVVLIHGQTTSAIARKTRKMVKVALKSRVSISMTKVSDLKPGNWLVVFNDSEDDEDMTKNDAFMTQMRDKLETCSLNSDSSEQSSDYFEAYTFRPLKKEGTPDSSGGSIRQKRSLRLKTLRAN